jgi:hypothetical protein
MILFDSKEEEYFSWYLDELVKGGFVSSWERSKTILLAENVKAWSKSGNAKPKQTVLLRDQTYTPDFTVFWTELAVKSGLVTSLVGNELSDLPESYKAPFTANPGNVSYLEVKGGFTEHDESRIYSILAKWTYQKHGIYIQRVMISTAPNSIFAKTFCPTRFLLTDKTMKPRKLKFEPRSIDFYKT